MERIYHPDIDGGRRVVEVPASAVAQHLQAGWLRADPGDLRARAVQLLVDGGFAPDEAERMVVAPTEPPDPPTTEEQQPEAPATAGASALPDESSPKRRRSEKE
ncbi:MAG TPA: hypothetical protein VMZ00_09265 [Sporichthya sp.]|nr:hypothetical protein [Sporichthya sp.]